MWERLLLASRCIFSGASRDHAAADVNRGWKAAPTINHSVKFFASVSPAFSGNDS